ncbi:PIN domain-containing protein [Streptomyces sp. NPDC127068]|uniref:PIN domain-containing protein n=1 Tax=Streptomyces sp. NPDC127068 TaxID=3347127 RepID=UPI0036685F5E
MLITPRPGAHPQNIRDALSSAHLAADNLRSAHNASTYHRLLQYLEWATDTSGTLRHQISDGDINRLILTRRYEVLLGSCGTLAGNDQERLVNGLVNLELAERAADLRAAVEALDDRLRRWSGQEVFVVADSSFYCHNPERLEDIDLHAILDLRPDMNVRLLLPITVVDELDGLKETSKQHGRWRATHTLGLLDRLLNGSTSGLWHRATTFQEENGLLNIRGDVHVEIVLDPPGHVRLAIADDEIIDRAVHIQALANREVHLLTCDTGQHTRGRTAGLKVTKIPTKDPGPEPDRETAGRQATGTRAKRRERQAAAGTGNNES